MADITSNGTGGGDWSAGGTWVGGSAPGAGDTATIAVGDTVTYDINTGSEVDLAGLTINGTLEADTAAGSYTLKVSANINGSGSFNIGSPSTDYPSTCTFVIDFDATASSFDGSGGLTCNFYCTNPTNTYVKLSGAEAAGQTALSVDTDVTSDEWSAGDTIWICNIANGRDAEERVIAAGGIAAGEITITAGLTNAKIEGAVVILQTRNVRVTNSTDHIFDSVNDSVMGLEIAPDSSKYALYASNTNTISGTISGCDRGLSVSYNNTISGTISGCTYALSYSNTNTISGTISGCTYALSASHNNTISGTISGCDRGLSASHNNTISGTISGCDRGLYASNTNTISGTISGCDRGLYASNNNTISGTISGCTYALSASHNNTISGTISGCTYALFNSYDCILYSTDLTSVTTENSGYNDTTSSPDYSYTPSYNHDNMAGAFKSWAKGGITTSQTASVPSGFIRWYRHACESASYYAFRQEVIALSPGHTLTVDSIMRLAGGDDLSANPPTVEIIDCANDPMWGGGASPLASAAIPTSDGSDTDWQTLTRLTYTNSGDIPMRVLVRAKASHASADVDESWAIEEPAGSGGITGNWGW